MVGYRNTETRWQKLIWNPGGRETRLMCLKGRLNGEWNDYIGWKGGMKSASS